MLFIFYHWQMAGRCASMHVISLTDGWLLCKYACYIVDRWLVALQVCMLYCWQMAGCCASKLVISLTVGWLLFIFYDSHNGWYVASHLLSLTWWLVAIHLLYFHWQMVDTLIKLIIDRPTKRNRPFTKLSNFSAEWKLGWFCTDNVFLIDQFKFVHELRIINKQAKIYSNFTTPVSFHHLIHSQV